MLSFAVVVVTLAACASGKTYVSGDTHDELRKAMKRDDGFNAALATPETMYLFSPHRVPSELIPLMLTLRDCKAQLAAGPSGVAVDFRSDSRNYVAAYARPQVLEIVYMDGRLHVEWRAGHRILISFETDKEVSWGYFDASPRVDVAWNALSAALARTAKGRPREWRAGSPFESMELNGFDVR